MPPASLARLKAVSMPSFIWRPSSLADPENGAETPNRISESVIPRITAMLVAADIGGCRPVADWGRVATARSGKGGGAAAGCGTCGSVAARADGGEKTPLTVGACSWGAPVTAGGSEGGATVPG